MFLVLLISFSSSFNVRNCLDGLIIKTKWSGEAETGELSLCLEYGNSTCTPLELNDKRFYTLVLHASIHAFFFSTSKTQYTNITIYRKKHVVYV